MTFKVFDKKTKKEVTHRVIRNIAIKGGIMEMDIDQFFVGEDGQIVLMDDCGRATWVDQRRFYVVPDEEKKESVKVIVSNELSCGLCKHYRLRYGNPNGLCTPLCDNQNRTQNSTLSDGVCELFESKYGYPEG